MTVQASASRSGGKSVGAAAVGILLTLGMFVVVFTAFLIAPIAALLIAFLIYTVYRGRNAQGGGNGNVPASRGDHAPHGFGAGTQ